MSLILNMLAVAPDLQAAATAHLDASSTVLADGINDTIRNQSNMLRDTIEIVAVLIAIAFVVYKAISSKFAIGTVLVSALVAGLLLWIVFQVETIQGWIGNDLDDGGSGNVRPEGAGIVQLYEPLDHDLVL